MMYHLFKRLFLKRILKDIKSSFGWRNYPFIEMNDEFGNGTAMNFETFTNAFKNL